MRFALIFLVVWLAAARAFSGETVTLRGAAQGTTWQVKFVAPADTVDPQKLQEAIQRELATIDQQMSTYRQDSEISRFNRAPAGEWFNVSKPVRDLISTSREISEATGGAQDITVGPLIRLWHFGPTEKGGQKVRRAFQPPTGAQIKKSRRLVGFDKLDFRYDRTVLRKQVEGLEVDLSSIAAGYTVDQLGRVLRKHGARNYLVELGGEVCAMGKRADGAPWRVAIERMRDNKLEMETAVPLENAAISTAGGDRHFFEHAGKRYSHIIDPATGRPIEHALQSVTVAADYCTQADGWDTPLLVMGVERGMDCAEKHGVAAMFIVRGERETAAEVKTTSAWRKRFGEK